MTAAFDRLRSLLEGLRIYDFSAASISGAELRAAGAAIDDLLARLTALDRERSPATAESEGLAMWEEALDLATLDTPDARRRAIQAKLAHDGSLDIAALARILTVCGAEVALSLSEDDREVLVIRFPGIGGVPEGFERMQKVIESLIPCHLEPYYHFYFITWLIFERRFRTWAALEAAAHTWHSLELVID